MPHDKNNRLLKVGDIVMVPAIVRDLSPCEDYCNVTVVNGENLPKGQVEFCVTLNSKQVEKAGNFDHEGPQPGDEGDPTSGG